MRFHIEATRIFLSERKIYNHKELNNILKNILLIIRRLFILCSIYELINRLQSLIVYLIVYAYLIIM